MLNTGGRDEARPSEGQGRWSALLRHGRLLRTYVILALLVAAVASPLAFSLLPLLLLGVFLYFEFRSTRPVARTAAHVMVFLGLPLAYQAILGAWSPFLVSLPLLALLDADLQVLTGLQEPELGGRVQSASVTRSEEKNDRILSGDGGSPPPLTRPTPLALRLSLLTVVSLSVALLLGNPALALASAVLGLFLVSLGITAWLRLRRTPASSTSATHRVIAGKDLSFTTHVSAPSRVAGWLHLVPSHEWLKATPRRLAHGPDGADVSFHVRPNLAGPYPVDVAAVVFDRWGLLRFNCSVRVAELNVIPRARYAAWLAQRYLESTRSGQVPLVSAVSFPRPSQRTGQGMDYHGSRNYQPGDSARRIDWKHTLKLGELVVREFDASDTAAALLLVNITVSDVEEADRLVYKWIAAALTLSIEGIPASIAIYDETSVRLVASRLDTRQIVARSLEAAKDVVVRPGPSRYLRPRDPGSLRSDIARLKNADEPSLAGLVEFLDLELKAMAETAASNPCTAALGNALGMASSAPTVLFLSARNHDVEAISVAQQRMKTTGQTYFDISLG